MAERSLRLAGAVLVVALGLGDAQARSTPHHAPVAAPAPSVAVPPPPAPAPTVAAAASGPRGFTIAVIGGAFAGSLADGLREDWAGDADVTILADTHAGFGLADPARFDPAADVRTLLAGKRIDAAAVMPGADDVKPLPDGDAVADPGTPRWRTLYGDRVAALADLFRSARTVLIWVGLPIVADDQLASDYAALNEIARDRAVQAGAVYVDSWDAFADEGGHFDPNGPDKDGRIVRLRAGDGRGFTKAGAVKLASFVDPALRRARADATAATAASTDVVLPSEPEIDADINAQIRRELGLPALTAPGLAPATESKAPAVIVTAPPLSPGGQLVAASIGPAPLAGTSGSLAQRALVEGRPIAPKAGRIDDFAWPRTP